LNKNRKALEAEQTLCEAKLKKGYVVVKWFHCPIYLW